MSFGSRLMNTACLMSLALRLLHQHIKMPTLPPHAMFLPSRKGRFAQCSRLPCPGRHAELFGELAISRRP